MKNILSSKLALLVVMVLMISMFPTAVLAQEEVIQSNAGTIAETINEKTADQSDIGATAVDEETLTTSAETYDGPYTYKVNNNKAVIVKYNGTEEDVVIPETVGGYDVVYLASAFANNDYVVSVKTPSTLKTIGYFWYSHTFEDCDNLKSITLNEGLEEIGLQSFKDCTSLESITIPDSVTFMADSIFWNCPSLKSVKLGSGLTKLDDFTFAGCPSLKTLVLGENIKTIDIYLCMESSLTSIVIPETVTSIDNSAFEDSPDLTIYGESGSYAESFAMAEKIDFEAINTNSKVNYTTHVQNVGWQDCVADGVMSGTSARGLRLEGIKIVSGIQGLGVSYKTHVQNIGWQDDVADGAMSGTSGKGLRLEGIQIQLTGEEVDKYDVYYRVHAQNVGWMGWAKNGADAGTAGYGYRLEGIEIEIVEKGAAAPGSTNNAFIQK